MLDRVLEDLLLDYITCRLTEEEQRNLHSRSAIEGHLCIDEDAVEDIQNRIYELLMDDVNWNALIRRIHERLPEEDEEEDNESTEDEDNSD